jgi:CelD/BcsL family acetyltransferase involved in cellulose biosynthesis
MLVENWQLLQVQRTADAAGLAPGWAALGGRALQPAGLNRPELLAAVLPNCPGAEILAVSQDSQLLLALAAEARRWPLPHTRSLTTPLSNAGTPHADSHGGEAALGALLRALPGPLLLSGIDATGPFWDALRHAAGPFAVLERWERAGLRLDGHFEGWFEENFDRKRRKEYRRLKARLGERGELACLALQPGEATGPWVADLLKLEEAGWKGGRGTALRQQPGYAEALAKAAERLHAGGHLRFWTLALDGQSIAALFAVVEGDRAWLGKIAYDEAYAKFSPGALLILEATERLFAEGGLAMADSCAIPGHPMIDAIWRDRLPMADVLVAAPGSSALRFRLTVLAETLRRKLRTRLRDIYYRLKGRTRS